MRPGTWEAEAECSPGYVARLSQENKTELVEWLKWESACLHKKNQPHTHTESIL
jgi:hypothetical protein